MEPIRLPENMRVIYDFMRSDEPHWDGVGILILSFDMEILWRATLWHISCL